MVSQSTLSCPACCYLTDYSSHLFPPPSKSCYCSLGMSACRHFPAKMKPNSHKMGGHGGVHARLEFAQMAKFEVVRYRLVREV